MPFKVKAIFEYLSEYEDDLTFSPGQLITVEEIEDEEWYFGSYDGSSGVFPKNFVEIVQSDTAATPAAPIPSNPEITPNAQKADPPKEELSQVETAPGHNSKLDDEPTSLEKILSVKQTAPRRLSTTGDDSTKSATSGIFPVSQNKRDDPYAVKKQFFGAGKSSYVPEVKPRDQSNLVGIARNDAHEGSEIVNRRNDDETQEESNEPKMSLKERIALLQKRQQEEAEREAAAIKRREERKKKQEEEKLLKEQQRKELGTNNTGASIDTTGSANPVSPSNTGSTGVIPDSHEQYDHTLAEDAHSTKVADEDKPRDEEPKEEEDDEDEEDEELKRRRLVERMAKISGGRNMFGMMGMPAPFGASSGSLTKTSKAPEQVKTDEEAKDSSAARSVPEAIPIPGIAQSDALPQFRKSSEPHNEDSSIAESDDADEQNTPVQISENSVDYVRTQPAEAKFDLSDSEPDRKAQNDNIHLSKKPTYEGEVTGYEADEDISDRGALPEEVVRKPEDAMPGGFGGEELSKPRGSLDKDSQHPSPPVPPQVPSASLVPLISGAPSIPNRPPVPTAPRHLEEASKDANSTGQPLLYENDKSVPAGGHRPIPSRPPVLDRPPIPGHSSTGTTLPQESATGVAREPPAPPSQSIKVPPPPIPSSERSSEPPIDSMVPPVPSTRAPPPPPSQDPPEGHVPPPPGHIPPPVPSPPQKPHEDEFQDANESSDDDFELPSNVGQPPENAQTFSLPPSVPTGSLNKANTFDSKRRTSVESIHRRSTELGRTRSKKDSKQLEQSQAEAHFPKLKEELENLADSSGWWIKDDVPDALENNVGSDYIFEIDGHKITKRGGRNIVYKDYYILFHDLSQIIVELEFESDDPRSTVVVSNAFMKPPLQSRRDVLEKYHAAFGNDVVTSAARLFGTKPSHGLVNTIYQQLKKGACPTLLSPIGGKSFGVVVYKNTNHSVAQYDDIRPGDILCIKNAKFTSHKGLSGLANKSIHVGEGSDVFAAVVMEVDTKKEKLRVLDLDHNGTVKKDSFKIGDMKTGKIRVFRFVDREFVGW